MKLFGFNDGQELPEKFYTIIRHEPDTKYAFCAYAGENNSQPVYALVINSGRGFQTQLFCGKNSSDLGYLQGGTKTDAENLCKFIRDNPNRDNLHDISNNIDQFYHDFYSGKKYNSDDRTK